MTDVSVIIPTYNRIELLPRALDSVTSQTCKAAEVIVIDDGSSDGTAEMIRDRYPSVQLIEQQNQGVSVARNRGIERSRSEWIAFLDSDDAWMPEKIERQLELLQAEPEAVLCHTEEIWIRNGVRVNPMKKHAKSGGWIYEACLPLCVISPSSTLVRRSLLLELGGFDPSLPACEDYALWLRICARHAVHFIEEPLTLKYGGHDDQLSRKHWGMDRFRVRALEKILREDQLSPRQRRATLAMLDQKLEILAGGARKRGRGEEADAYLERQEMAKAELLRLAGG